MCEKTQDLLKRSRKLIAFDHLLKQRVDNSSCKVLVWRPRRDLNPRYRRESTRANGKLLKLRNTDGYLTRFQ